jgi:hypothetical protein
VFVNCGNPDCYHNTELDVSRFPDDVTFNDLQPRMLCTVCDHRGADVGPSWLHHGWLEPPLLGPIPCPAVASPSHSDAAEKRVPYGSIARRPPDDVTKLLTSGNIIPSPDFVLSGEGFSMNPTAEDLHHRLDQLQLLASETDDPLAERLVRDLIVEIEDMLRTRGALASEEK